MPRLEERIAAKGCEEFESGGGAGGPGTAIVKDVGGEELAFEFCLCEPGGGGLEGIVQFVIRFGDCLLVDRSKGTLRGLEERLLEEREGEPPEVRFCFLFAPPDTSRAGRCSKDNGMSSGLSMSSQSESLSRVTRGRLEFEAPFEVDERLPCR